MSAVIAYTHNFFPRKSGSVHETCRTNYDNFLIQKFSLRQFQPPPKLFSTPARTAKSFFGNKGHFTTYGNSRGYSRGSPFACDKADISLPPPHLRCSASGPLRNSEAIPIFNGRPSSESTDFPIEETRGPKGSEGHLPTFAAGQKRRASSPPVDDRLHLLRTGSASDLRSSLPPHLHFSPGSVSSIRSDPRNSSSYASTLSIAPSSTTTMSSYGRPPPGGLSPSGLSPCGVSPRSADGSNDSPHTTSSSVTASPRGSVSSPSYQQQPLETRPTITARKSSDRGAGQVKRITTNKLYRLFICKCCPKKPKKFDNEEELK
jgi:hypothetical protein